MFDMNVFATISDNERAELIREFVTEYALSESTATMAVDLFLTLASAMPEHRAEAEFHRSLLESVARVELWAVEFVQAMFNKRLPGFRATYERARTKGQDPVAELVREHALPAAAAVELAALLASETGGTSKLATADGGVR